MCSRQSLEVSHAVMTIVHGTVPLWNAPITHLSCAPPHLTGTSMCLLGVRRISCVHINIYRTPKMSDSQLTTHVCPHEHLPHQNVPTAHPPHCVLTTAIHFQGTWRGSSGFGWRGRVNPRSRTSGHQNPWPWSSSSRPICCSSRASWWPSSYSSSSTSTSSTSGNTWPRPTPEAVVPLSVW